MASSLEVPKPSRHSTAVVAGFSFEALRLQKRHSVTGITEKMTGSSDCAREGNSGRRPMKTLLVGIAFVAMGMVFASQAFALPYCPNSTWQHGHYVCASYDE
jgi:hypothetical protein